MAEDKASDAPEELSPEDAELLTRVDFQLLEHHRARNRPVILYSGRGDRARRLAHLLRSMGYTNVYNLRGGLEAWKEAGFEVEGEKVGVPG